jgi:serine/threonine protein kinase
MEEPKVGQKRSVDKAGFSNATGGPPLSTKWKVELPPIGAGDDLFGGCRSVEHCYKKEQQIGEGTYGQVYLAQDVKDNSQVALKKVTFLQLP